MRSECGRRWSLVVDVSDQFNYHNTQTATTRIAMSLSCSESSTQRITHECTEQRRNVRLCLLILANLIRVGYNTVDH